MTIYLLLRDGIISTSNLEKEWLGGRVEDDSEFLGQLTEKLVSYHPRGGEYEKKGFSKMQRICFGHIENKYQW